MKVCSNCGALMGDRAEKCNSCGRPFPVETISAETASAEGTVETISENTAAIEETASAEDTVETISENTAAIEGAAETTGFVLQEDIIPESAEPSEITAFTLPGEEKITAETTGDTPVLDLGTDTFVKPPEFPEDKPENKIELTLGNETAADDAAASDPTAPVSGTVTEDIPSGGEAPKIVPPVYPEPPVQEPEKPETEASSAQAPTGNAGQAPGYGTAGNAGGAYGTGAAGNVPPQGAAPHTDNTAQGGRVNLTQQAINDQNRRRTEGGTGYQSNVQYNAAAGSVTGTTGFVLGLIGLVLVVVFGAIGSCTGVAAYSFIFTIIGLVLCIIGLVKSSNDRKVSGGTCTRANTAFVLSLIGVIIGALLLIIGLSCVGCVGCLACSAVNSAIY